MVPGPHEGLLIDILRVGLPAQHAKRQGIHKPGISAHQAFEIFPIARFGLLHQGNHFRDLQPTQLLVVLFSDGSPQYGGYRFHCFDSLTS
jgi:hypothetical protein